MKRIALILIALVLVAGSVFAVDKYAADMEEKYPEITDTHYPQELAEVMVEYSDLGSKMEQAMSVLMQHMMEPEVQEAMERME